MFSSACLDSLHVTLNVINKVSIQILHDMNFTSQVHTQLSPPYLLLLSINPIQTSKKQDYLLLLSLNLMFYFTVSISLVISNPQGNMSLLLLNLNLMFYFTVSISRVISNSQCNIMSLLYCVVSAINHIFYIRCIPYGLVWIIMGLKIMSHVCHIKIWKKLSLVVYFPLILECWNRTMIINLLVTIVKYFPRGKLARDNYVR